MSRQKPSLSRDHTSWFSGPEQGEAVQQALKLLEGAVQKQTESTELRHFLLIQLAGVGFFKSLLEASFHL